MRSGTQGTAGVTSASALNESIVVGMEYTLTFNFAVEGGDGTGTLRGATAAFWAVSDSSMTGNIDLQNAEVVEVTSISVSTNTSDMSSSDILTWTGTSDYAGHRLVIALRTNDFNHPIFFDNVQLTAIPEPASLALLGLGGLLMLGRGRREA